MHSVAGARLPVQRRQLSLAELPEDEASDDAHEELQEKDERRLSYVQAADRTVLLPRETLPGDQVSRSVLLQHQAQDKAAATITTSATAQEANGCDEYEANWTCS